MQDEKRIEDAKRRLRRAAGKSGCFVASIAKETKLDETIVRQLKDEFENLSLDPIAVQTAKEAIAKGAVPVDKLAKATDLDEYTIRKLEYEYQHSPLEGEDAMRVTGMLMQGMSHREIARKEKLNENKVNALVDTLEGSLIDESYSLIKAKMDRKDVAAKTGLHEHTISRLEGVFDKQPLVGIEAEYAKQMLLDGLDVGAISHKAETRMSHDAIKQLIPQLESVNIEKAKQMIKNGVHVFDIQRDVGVSLEVVNYWKEKLS
ncbi:MAG: hypothetical protein FWE44_05295 [Defluviitaleaceae bacterium]|nr:hypothetical protein [Defluviitaleaceae bacterium]